MIFRKSSTTLSLDDTCVLISTDAADEDEKDEDKDEDEDEDDEDENDHHGMGIFLVDDQLGLAERFSGKTLVLSKRSILGDNPMINTEDGRQAPAKIVAHDRYNDLALLVTDAGATQAVSISEILSRDQTKKMGEFLLCPHPETSGHVSVVASRPFTSKRKGFLGIQMADSEEKIVLEEVVPNSAADKGGLKVGDVILAVDGEAVSKNQELIDILSEHIPGDSLILDIEREDSKFSTRVTLLGESSMQGPDMMPMHIADSFDGGKSEIHSGFKEAIAHDARVIAAECGGPVFDLNGSFVGFNAARVSRTHCFLLPASIIEEFLRSVNEGKHLIK